MPETQQEFLRRAGEILKLTPNELAERMGAPWTTFRKWIPETDKKSNYRDMPEIAWQLVREILAHEALKKKMEKVLSAKKVADK